MIQQRLMKLTLQNWSKLSIKGCGIHLIKAKKEATSSVIWNIIATQWMQQEFYYHIHKLVGPMHKLVIWVQAVETSSLSLPKSLTRPRKQFSNKRKPLSLLSILPLLKGNFPWSYMLSNQRSWTKIKCVYSRCNIKIQYWNHSCFLQCQLIEFSR